ncbi:Signal transduction histidine kinase [Paraburkholderia caballeronis]|uniref:histidine kinase n=1 Tax=Paraburkholderia caballeronis TaxID=416943 RepID=A0A1H7RSD6_9BURK|nr:signal transduction histidine kinase [Paraburkholderia caballeronis]PXW97852.1 signal transduction histidine kinase [Paraburkholderia caballeronis]RAJ94822.1 signal transduction histidine kinase [Paraburkholderia caballeronis]SEE63013.1 Signal transduction histidine kinase [Paraburkholderia caballeronis]SEL63095.1 Signal transduction histidine kinase [Paraburkholderia caballeronis]
MAGHSHSRRSSPVRGSTRFRSRQQARRSDVATTAALQRELDDSRLLHEISLQLLVQQDLATLYGKIVETACELMGAQFGSMQMLTAGRAGESELTLIAHRGFMPEAAAYWRKVYVDSTSTCAMALVSGDRVVVPNVEACEPLTGTVDLQLYRRNGIRAVQTTPLRSRDGKLIGMLSTHWAAPHEPMERELCLLDLLARQAADLIERTRSEAALRDSEARLQHADRMKDQFLATLAHELRNPLASIRNALQIVRLDDERRRGEQVLGMLDRQVDHIVRLVDDLFELSRISTGALELQRAQVELGGALRAALDQSCPMIERGRHELTVRMPDEPLTVDGDEVRLVQVFSNLMNNAAKYTPEGGRIDVSLEGDDDHAVVRIADNGIGIAPEDHDRLFELFGRLQPTTAHAESGLGIGLSLVRRLVELHRGVVDAYSEGTGKGSCFTVRLPLVRSTPARASTPGEARGEIQPGLKVLIVDDNRDAGDSLGMLLELFGCDVRVEQDGDAALHTLGQFVPAVVMLDLGMPDMDGFEVARQLRADPRHAGTILVAVTGWGQPEDRERTREAGFDHHLVKPVSISTLQRIFSAASEAVPPG